MHSRIVLGKNRTFICYIDKHLVGSLAKLCRLPHSAGASWRDCEPTPANERAAVAVAAANAAAAAAASKL